MAVDVAPVARARIAAAIVHKREIISLGVCRYKTHPLQKEFSDRLTRLYLHAEIDAIQNFLRRHDKRFLSSCSLYVARIKGPQGALVDGLAKPCEGCERCIKHFKINQVYWTSDN